MPKRQKSTSLYNDCENSGSHNRIARKVRSHDSMMHGVFFKKCGKERLAEPLALIRPYCLQLLEGSKVQLLCSERVSGHDFDETTIEKTGEHFELF
jgi:hypothetical protein